MMEEEQNKKRMPAKADLSYIEFVKFHMCLNINIYVRFFVSFFVNSYRIHVY